MTDWIDITDELPPLDEFVLVTNAATNYENGYVAIVRRIGRKTPIWWSDYIGTFEGIVTHWIAFPRPPSKEVI